MTKVRLHIHGGEKGGSEVTFDELSAAMAEISGGWIDIHRPEEDSCRPFLEGEMGFFHLAVDDCFAEPVSGGFVYDDHKFFAFKARDQDRDLDTEHLRAFLKGEWLVTVRHAHMPGINEFRKRFYTTKVKRLAKIGSEYLLYELLDSVADDWYKVLEKKSHRLDELEDQVFDPSQTFPDLLEDLHELKRDLREVAKSTTPLQEVVHKMLRTGENFVTEETLVYFQDLDALTQDLVRRVENYNSGAASTRDTYISQSHMRAAEAQAEAGEVMRLLTIIATIMLPITAIASIFGMNVSSFGAGDGPVDLKLILGIMGATGGVILLWLYSKGHIGRKR
jgi:magnesium transporter